MLEEIDEPMLQSLQEPHGRRLLLPRAGGAAAVGRGSGLKRLWEDKGGVSITYNSDLVVWHIPDSDSQPLRFWPKATLDAEVAYPMVSDEIASGVGPKAWDKIVNYRLRGSEPSASDRYVRAVETEVEPEPFVVSYHWIVGDFGDRITPFVAHGRVTGQIQGVFRTVRKPHFIVLDEESRNGIDVETRPDLVDWLVEDDQNWVDEVVEVEGMSSSPQRRHDELEVRVRRLTIDSNPDGLLPFLLPPAPR